MTKPITDRPLKKPGQKGMPYDPEVGAEVCVRLMEGQSLKAICEDPDLPSERTIYRWIGAEPTFRQAYAQARTVQMDAWADDVVAIADDGSGDFVEKVRADGSVEMVLDKEAVQRSKLRIDTRLWLMARLNAKKFGDKVEVDVSTTVKVEEMTDAELVDKATAHLEKLGIAVPTTPLLLGHLKSDRAAAAATPSPSPAPDQDDET